MCGSVRSPAPPGLPFLRVCPTHILNNCTPTLHPPHPHLPPSPHCAAAASLAACLPMQGARAGNAAGAVACRCCFNLSLPVWTPPCKITVMARCPDPEGGQGEHVAQNVCHSTRRRAARQAGDEPSSAQGEPCFAAPRAFARHGAPRLAGVCQGSLRWGKVFCARWEPCTAPPGQPGSAQQQRRIGRLAGGLCGPGGRAGARRRRRGSCRADRRPRPGGDETHRTGLAHPLRWAIWKGAWFHSTVLVALTWQGAD